jgi:sugar phosphate isomerase/epimerase
MPRLSVFPKGFFNDLVERRMSVFQWIDLAATLDGVEGVELYPRFFESLDAAYVARVKQAASARKLELPMMCNSPDFTHPDPAYRARQIDETRTMLSVTRDLGGAFCRVLSGQNRPGLDPALALSWVTDSLWQLVPHAQATGVVMAIENHYKDGLWDYPEWAQSQARYLAILDAVNTPWLVAQYDPSNAIVAGEDQYQLLDRILPRMKTMQASDRYLEGGSIADLKTYAVDPMHGYAKIVKHGIIGNGLNDYDRIFGAMARAGYDGWISIEDGEGPTVEEGMANLRASVAFLRGKVAQHFGASPGRRQ